MKTLITLLFLAALLYSGYQLYTGYQETTGTVKKRLWDTFNRSATVVLAFSVRVLDAFAGALSGVADWFNLPQVQEALQLFFTPEVAMILFLIMAILFEWARKRKGSREPVS